MTQKESLIKMFRDKGGWLTLSEILQTSLAAEYRARFTELRRDGYSIVLERGKRPSENIYRFTEPVKTHEIDGQVCFI